MKTFGFFLVFRMCSLVDGAICGEEDVSDTLSTSSASISTNDSATKTCQKCRVTEAILKLRKKDVYCKECFLISCHHKFRSTLGKNKAMQVGDSVLVAFSGSQGSLALLKLIRSSFQDDVNLKRVRYSVNVVVIDESNLGYDFQTVRVVTLAKTFGFPVHVVHLSSALTSKPAREDEGLEELNLLLGAIDNVTSQELMLKQLRTRVLIRVAKELECKKIFLGECATSLAVGLLSGVAVGRGKHVSHESAFCDKTCDGEVELLRPLREFSINEVAFFHQYCDDEEQPVPHVTFSAGKDPKFGDIRRLTESFVLGLQEGFPSTVPTIFRIGDKLAQVFST